MAKQTERDYISCKRSLNDTSSLLDKKIYNTSAQYETILYRKIQYIKRAYMIK